MLRGSSPRRAFLPVYFFFAAHFLNLNALELFAIDSTCHTLLGLNSTACDELPEAQRAHVSSVASHWVMWISVSMNGLAVPITVVLTRQSDRIGRRPVMLLASGCYALGMSIATVVVWRALPLWYLLPSYLLIGLGGGFGSFLAAAFAFTADGCPDVRSRSVCFSLLESALFLGGMSAPPLGDWLYSRHPIAPFCLVTGYLCISFCFALLTMRDARHGGRAAVVADRGVADRADPEGEAAEGEAATAPSDEAHAAGATDATDAAGAAVAAGTTGNAGAAGTAGIAGGVSAPWVWCLIFGFSFCARTSLVQLLPLYTKLSRFSLTPAQLGGLASLSYGCKWLALVVVVPVLVRCAADPQVGTLRAVRIGVTVGTAAVAAVGLCRDTPQLVVAVAVEGFSQLMTPATRALVVSSAPPSRSGRVLGYLANVEMLCSIASPLLAGTVYAATVRTDPTLAFLTISGTVGLASVALSLYATAASPGGGGGASAPGFVPSLPGFPRLSSSAGSSMSRAPRRRVRGVDGGGGDDGGKARALLSDDGADVTCNATIASGTSTSIHGACPGTGTACGASSVTPWRT
jgi:MFS family permease